MQKKSNNIIEPHHEKTSFGVSNQVRLKPVGPRGLVVKPISLLRSKSLIISPLWVRASLGSHKRQDNFCLRMFRVVRCCCCCCCCCCSFIYFFFLDFFLRFTARLSMLKPNEIILTDCKNPNKTKRATLTLYRSPDYQAKFVSTGLLVQEKKFNINVRDGGHGCHL